jgi:hypothetical protein
MNSQSHYQSNIGNVGTYSADTAKQMLTSDGFSMNGGYMTKGGKTLEIGFTIPSGIQSSKNEGELFQAMMKVIGVKVDIKTVPSNDFFDKYIIPGNFDVSPFSWIGTPFPISSSLSIYKSPKAGGGQNFTGLANPQVDKLLDQAVAETDQNKAVADVESADKLLYQEVHAVPAPADVWRQERHCQPWLVRLRNGRLHQDRLHEVIARRTAAEPGRIGRAPLRVCESRPVDIEDLVRALRAGSALAGRRALCTGVRQNAVGSSTARKSSTDRLRSARRRGAGRFAGRHESHQANGSTAAAGRRRRNVHG